MLVAKALQFKIVGGTAADGIHWANTPAIHGPGSPFRNSAGRRRHVRPGEINRRNALIRGENERAERLQAAQQGQEYKPLPKRVVNVAKRATARTWDNDKQELQGGAFGGAGALVGGHVGSRYSDARTAHKRDYGPRQQVPRKAALKYATSTRGANKYKLAALAGLGAAGGYGITRAQQKHRAKAVAKRMDPDKRLRAQKKVQAISSMVGGTVGLTGLGLLAAGKKYPKGLDHLPKVSAVGGGIGGTSAFNFASIQNQESKKKAPRQNVYVVRNKKQIKSIKSGLQPVTKGMTVMDYGLNDVHQGQSVISKRERKYETPESAALQQKAERTGKQAGTAGTIGSAGALGWYGANMHADLRAMNKKGLSYKQQKYNLKGQSKNIREAYTHATKAGWNGHDPIARRKTIKPMAQFAARAVRNNPHAAAGKVAGAAAIAGIGSSFALTHKGGKEMAAAQGLRDQNRRAQLKASRTQVGKASDWMNISEHQRRAVDSRRTARRGDKAVGWGTALASGAMAHRALANGPGEQNMPTVGGQLKNLKSSASHAKEAFHWQRAMGTSRGSAGSSAAKSMLHAAGQNPHGAAMVAAGTLAAGGVATHITGRVNEKRHNKAIAVQRRKRVSKELVFKAYNPEDKRQRRLEHTSTGLSVGSGAAAAGSAAYGAHAARQFKSANASWKQGRQNEGVRQSVINDARDRGSKMGKGASGNAQNLKNWKRAALHPGGSRNFGEARLAGTKGLKSAGKAGALGLTAVGLAVGSDRVRSYKRGRGQTYRPLVRAAG